MLEVCLTLVWMFAAVATGKPASPSYTWPEQYEISWELTIPYIDTYQKGKFNYTYTAWQDLTNARQKIVRDGLEEVLILVEPNEMFQYFPAYEELICWRGEVHGGTGPTLSSAAAPASAGHTSGHAPDQNSAASSQQRRRLQSTEVGTDPYLFEHEKRPAKFLTFVLPELSEERWRYVDRELYKQEGEAKSILADVYEWDLTMDDMPLTYKFFVSEDGVPLKLWMLGTNLMTGGHKDEYIMTYRDYKVYSIPNETFAPREGFRCGPPQPLALTARNTLLDSMRRTLPNVHHGDSKYDHFAHRHGRRHYSGADYEARKQVFFDNVKFVEEWNAQQGWHRVAINRFGDWTHEEYLAFLRSSKKPAARGERHLHKVSASPHMLPKTLIWRGTPADSPVKDQAACGSCWAFSTVAAFESAYFRITGKQQLLSEQHLIDCGWEVDNHGCYGGYQRTAFPWVFMHGGIARSEDYPYRGINDFCRKNASEVKFSGKTVVVEGGELAVMDALMTQGPLTVSIDASDPSFKFYAGGVYVNPNCTMDLHKLDHAVVLSGYDTTEDDIDVWLVKNIWSPFWGEGGYMRVPRKPNDCGVASEAMYVDVTISDE